MYVKCAAEMICVGLFSRFCSGFILLEFLSASSELTDLYSY